MGNLNHYSKPEELLRVKKTLQFIYEVVRSYRMGLHEHVGFSCAMAISKAEEMLSQISNVCPAYSCVEELIKSLNDLYLSQVGQDRAFEALDKIHSYFHFERYVMTPKP